MEQRMSRHSDRLLRLLLGLLVVCVALTGCSAKQPDVDRVQPNLVDKSMFEGEWWYSSTIVDTTYDASFVASLSGASIPFSGSMSADLGLDFNRLGGYAFSPVGSAPMGRIRWLIDEDYLFAFRTFELTAGGNDDGRSPDFQGQPLAVFAIEEHVDVQQDYNSVTGETSNVTSENTEDRRWWERQYMRVDWSENLVTEFVTLGDNLHNGLFDRFERTSTSFFVQEDSREDLPASYRPQFVHLSEDPDYRFKGDWGEVPEGDDPVHYMSFVTREIWTPGASCGLCSAVNTTLRHSFLRVPPNHEYAAETITNREFERFGIIRSRQPTYVRGGQDKAVQRVHCDSDADCGEGGACDPDEHICVGGLTEDRGETDFLAQYMSRHGFYADSLTDQACVSDWECDRRHDSCEELLAASEDPDASCEQIRRDHDGSRCDPAARHCTIPLRKRPVRAVEYTLTKHFPPYLVRRAFEAVGEWNLALMRGQRAVSGVAGIDQQRCSDESGSRCPCDGKKNRVCTVNLSEDLRVDCQDEDPTKYCYCDGAEATRGTCPFKYDPFATPEAQADLGVPSPYDCHIEGPDDVGAPRNYTDYDPETAYGYRFVGDECMLTLRANACDVDGEAPCQELGDLRYQFLNFIDQGVVPFSGVSIPLSDPHNGELIVANAAISGYTMESLATTTSQYFPVLTGAASEDSYFTGENVRGYFARLGLVEHPVATVTATGDGSVIKDPSRPSGVGDQSDETEFATLSELKARMEAISPRLEQLQGQDGRAAIFSDRRERLAQSSVAGGIDAALQAAGQEFEATAALMSQSLDPTELMSIDTTQDQTIAVDRPLDQVMNDRLRTLAMSANRYDVIRPSMFESQYWQYWANTFEDRTPEEASIRIQQAVFQSVITHEVGHSLGLEHNFAASLDRNQYHDAYFRLARRTPLPDYLDYDSPELGGDEDMRVNGAEAQRWAKDLQKARETRLAAGLGNVATSSVMDYPGDLSDLAGVGRYDQAAILFSYFNTLEAYETGDPTVDPQASADDTVPSSLGGLEYADSYRRELWSYYRGGEACTVDDDCPFSAGKETSVFQPLTQRCVTNPRELRQQTGCRGEDNCLCSNFYDDFAAYQSADAYRSRSEEPQWAPVEYLYCDDSRVNDLSWCTMFDAGESFLETVAHYRTQWLQQYPRQYFRNFRLNGPSRAYSQMFVPDAVKIYQHLFFRRNFEEGFTNNRGPLGYNDQLLASADVFNWLTEIIAMPDVGTYAMDDTTGAYEQISHELRAPGGAFDLPLGQGFHLWSEYQEGLNGFNRVERAGTFTDKVLALDAITERDWQLSFTVDERYFVNFYDFFPREVVDVFGGLILQRPEQYAPRVSFDDDGKPRLTYLSNLRLGARGTNAETYPEPAVSGVDSLALRALSLYVALANFPVYFDTSFEQQLLVFKLGSGDGYKIPDTLSDGTPLCAYGADNCDDPAYIVYESDRLHTSYVAVTINTGSDQNVDEQQLGYHLLLQLSQRQERIRELQAADSLDAADTRELSKLRRAQEADEGFVELLIELGHQLGISSFFF